MVEIYSYFANKRSLFIEMSQKVWYHITMTILKGTVIFYGQFTRKTL